MKKIKKISLIITSLAIAMSLASCSINTNNNTSTTTTSVTSDVPQKEYSFVKFEWADDNSSASLVLSNGTDIKTVVATVTKTTKAATCDEQGSITYVASASYDGKEYSRSKIVTIDKLGHKWGVPQYKWSDDFKTVTATRVCLNDSTHIETETKETTYTIIKDPTYTEKGTGKYSVTFENEAFETQNHIVDIPILDPEFDLENITWTWNGYESCYATLQSKVDDEYSINIDAVITSEVTKAATASETGIMTYTATITYKENNYTNTKTKELPKLELEFVGFEWDSNYNTAKAKYVYKDDATNFEFFDAQMSSEVIKESTCLETGEIKIIATYDGHSDYKTKYTNKLGHDFQFDSFWWNNDYTADAQYKCSRCGEYQYFSAVVTSEITKQPTCEETGIRTYTATYDGHTSTKEEVIPALGHDYDVSTLAWVWNGYNSAYATITCKNDATHQLKIDATITSEITKEATLEENGIRTYTATITYEGNNYTNTKTEIIAKANYQFDSFVWNMNDMTAKAKYVCSGYDDIYYDATVGSSIKTPATCEEYGVTLYTATYDGHTDSKELSNIAPIGHDYDLDNIVWTWNAYSSAYATLICKNDNSHTLKVDASITSVITTEAKCETPGVRTYTATITYEGNTYTNTKTEEIPALGHNYQISYSWNGYSCTAKRICLNDATEVVTETVTATKETEVLATASAAGYVKYVATFTNTIFEAQSMNETLYYVSFVDNNGDLITSFNNITDGGKVSSVDNPIISTSGSATLAYVFNGWMVNGTIVNLKSYTVTSNNVLFKPKFVKYELKVNIDAAGTMGGLASDALTTSSKKTITAQTNDGYVLLGINKTINGETTRYKDATGVTTKINSYTLNDTSDVVFTAIYMAMPITSTYDSTMGTVTIPDKSYKGETITIKANTNNGYSFKGFYLNGVLYSETDGIANDSFDITLTEDMEALAFEAKWVTCPVTIEVNNETFGYVDGYDGTSIYGETKSLTATPKTGYSFVKWMKDGADYSVNATIDVTFSSEATYQAVFKSYTLTTINDNILGGTITQYTNENMTVGNNVTLTVTLNDGYTFLGWYKNDSATPESTDLNYTFVMPAEDLTYTAKFAVYTITTTNNNEAYGSVTIYTDEKIRKGESVTLTATINTGYTFLGWYDVTNSAYVSTDSTYVFDMPGANLNYQARFEKYTIKATANDDSYGTVVGYSKSNISKVTFNLNGGTGDVETQYVSATSEIKYPNVVTKSGYVFSGWYSDSACTTLYDFTADLTGDITLYAGYVAMNSTGFSNTYVDFTRDYSNTNTYKVTLNGTSSSSYANTYFTSYVDGNIEIHYKSSLTAVQVVMNITNLTTGEIIKSNNTFSNLYDASLSISVAKGDVICISNYINETNEDSFAYLYINGNDLPEASGLCKNVSYAEATNVTAGYEITLYATPIDGYSFIGWYNASDELVSSDAEWTFNKAKADEVYVAKFVAYKLTVNASYKNDDPNAGNVTTYANKNVSAGSEVKLQATLNDGYTFLGWYRNDSTDAESTDLNYTITMPKKDTTFTAKYTYYLVTIESSTADGDVGGVSAGNYVYVSFNTNGGNETYDKQTVRTTTALTYPGNPTKDGYVFTGWYTDSTCNTLFDFESEIVENITLYAGYYQINVTNTNSLTVLDVTALANSEENAHSVSGAGVGDTKSDYAYFSIPKTGTYRLYYKNSAAVLMTGFAVYNTTTSEYIQTAMNTIDLDYQYVQFTANQGDVIYVKSYSYEGNTPTFTYYVNEYSNGVTSVPTNVTATSICGPLSYSNTKIKKGTVITLTAKEATGYTFDGWYEYDWSTSSYVKISSNLTCNITVGSVENAKYKAVYSLN